MRIGGKRGRIKKEVFNLIQQFDLFSDMLIALITKFSLFPFYSISLEIFMVVKYCICTCTCTCYLVICHITQRVMTQVNKTRRVNTRANIVYAISVFPVFIVNIGICIKYHNNSF